LGWVSAFNYDVLFLQEGLQQNDTIRSKLGVEGAFQMFKKWMK